MKLHPCKFLHATGVCKNGVNCEFSHERLDHFKINTFIEDNEEFLDQVFEKNGTTNLGDYYIQFKRAKEIRVQEQKQEAYNAKISGSMLPETIKKDLVVKDVGNGYQMIYNDNLPQIQRNPSVPPRLENFNEMNRLQVPTNIQCRNDVYPQNMISHVNVPQEKYVMNNQLHIRLPHAANQMQMKQYANPPQNKIPGPVNYIQNVQQYGMGYSNTTPSKAMAAVPRQMYGIQGVPHMAMAKQPQQYVMTPSPIRNENMEKLGGHRNYHPKEFPMNKRNDMRYTNSYEENKGKAQQVEHFDNRNEEYFST